MDQKMPDFLKNALTHGLIFGIVFIVLQLLFWMLNFIPVGIGMWMMMLLFNLILSIIIISIVTKDYRQNMMGGFISYGQALGYGFTVYMIGTIFLLIFTLIFTNFIDPQYLDRVMQASADWTEKFMKSRGAPDKEIAKALEKMAKKPTILKTIRTSLISGAITGLISSLLSSGFVRKLDNPLKD